MGAKRWGDLFHEVTAKVTTDSSSVTIMSSKGDINRRVLAIQAKKKRKNPKGRNKAAGKGGGGGGGTYGDGAEGGGVHTSASGKNLSKQMSSPGSVDAHHDDGAD